MGKQWRKAQKAINGNPVDFVDGLDGQVTGLSGVVTVTTLVRPSRAPRAGQVDYVLVDITPPVTSGVLNVAVYNNGTAIASGVVNSTAGNGVEKLFHDQSSNAGSPPVIASGSFTHVEYSVSTKIGEDGQIGRALNVRVGLRYRD